jgi:hypothetical protein
LKGKPLRRPAIGWHHKHFARSFLVARKRQQFAIRRKMGRTYFAHPGSQPLGSSAFTRYKPEVILSNKHYTILIDSWKAYISL